MATTKVDARELQKAKNQLAAQAIYQRERVSGLASNIGVDWVVAHDPLRPFTSAAKYDAVTADDVLRVAKKYLVKTQPQHADAGAAPSPRPQQEAEVSTT